MPTDPLFIGCYPTGLVYADRTRERHGDYVRLAYLNYRTLTLDLEKDCPPALATRIQAHATDLQARRGQPFAIAGNLTITPGQ